MSIITFEEGEVIGTLTYPFEISMNDIRCMEIFKASCNVLQLQFD